MRRLFRGILYFFVILVTAVTLAYIARADEAVNKVHALQGLSSDPGPDPATVVGVRGLDKSKDSGDTSARDYPAIDRLDKITATPAEIAAFRKEGHLR